MWFLRGGLLLDAELRSLSACCSFKFNPQTQEKENKSADFLT